MGSCRGSYATGVQDLNGPCTPGPQARRFGDMPCPAQGPEHASQLAYPTTGRLSSTPSAADVVGLVRGFIGTTQPSDSSCLPGWLRSAELPTPIRDRRSDPPRSETAAATSGGRRSPRFRRVPFRRDVVSDPGRATAPRIAAPHILPSTFPTASASATSGISGLNTYPTGLLCTLRSRRHRRPRNTRYRATRYRPTRAGLPPAGTRQLRLMSAQG